MLQIGWASKDITPDKPVWLCGYAARTKKSDGAHDPLFAKTCYLSDGKMEAALISCDLIALSYEQEQTIRRMTKECCGVENIVVAATHTHSGPGTCQQLEFTPGTLDQVWIDNVLERIAESVSLAKQAAQPGTIYVASSVVPEVAKNRRTGETVTDAELRVLWAENLSGEVSGIMVNYACHATILDSSNYLISADFPYYLCEGLQKRFQGAVAMFFNGACGDLNIGYSADSSALGVDMGELRGYRNAEKMAAHILEGVWRAMQSPVQLAPELIFRRIPLRFPMRDDMPDRQAILNEMDELKRSGLRDINAKTRQIYLSCLFTQVKTYCADSLNHLDGESVILCIGNALIVTIPGELFCEIGIQIKNIFSEKHIPLLFGYANGYFGYLPTRKAFIAGGYECETSVHCQDTEQYLLKTMKKAANSI